MQKSCRYFLVCVIAAGLFACVREPHEASSGSSPQRASRLSVDEARAFFEKKLPSDVTRASDAVPTGPFVVENVLPDWEGAEQSSNKRIACVDVPAQTGSEFLIKRRRADGTFYGVRAYGKLLVVKSMQTDSLSTYMRYLVPDEIYATFYDGDLSNLFANCEDRGDYCGLELYTTLDGAVVAAARYYEGTLLASVFICDTRMSEFERSWRLRNLLAGVYINRLHRGIPLQADPTVRYAIGDFTLKRILNRHLKVDSPYNTYQHAGLPPGPIRMPSVAAIDAVLGYAEHDYLYFCARPDFSGYHAFARTLAEHNRNARAYAAALDRRGIR